MSEPSKLLAPSTDAVVVVAHDYGGSGPTVLLCHATGFHGRYWDPVCAALASSYRCVALDFRGHGDSPEPRGDLDWKGFGSDVLAVVDALGEDSVLAVGHSMGGCAAIMAEQVRPGTIEAAWVFEPIIFADADAVPEAPGPRPGNPLADSARRRREVFESRERAFERYRSRPPFDAVDSRALRAYVDHGFEDLEDGTVRLKCRGAFEAAVFETHETNVFEHLCSVRPPVTVAVGSGEDGPAALGSLIAEELPHGRFELYENLSHFGPMEAPEPIADAIAQTFERR